MSGISTVASRSNVDLPSFSWHLPNALTFDHDGLRQRLIKMRESREAREQTGTIKDCANLYRLASRGRFRGQRNIEQRAMAHWFADKGIEYIPQIRHMLSPVHTSADELAQMHLSGCLIRNPVVVGLESECKHGNMAMAI